MIGEVTVKTPDFITFLRHHVAPIDNQMVKF